MRIRGLLASGFILVAGLVLLLMGCAGEPVRIDLPANHPANPEAAEAAYISDPDPFQTGMLLEEPKSADGAAISGKSPEGSHSHDMQRMQESRHDSSTKLPGKTDETTEHTHQEPDR